MQDYVMQCIMDFKFVFGANATVCFKQFKGFYSFFYENLVIILQCPKRVSIFTLIVLGLE